MKLQCNFNIDIKLLKIFKKKEFRIKSKLMVQLKIRRHLNN